MKIREKEDIVEIGCCDGLTRAALLGTLRDILYVFSSASYRLHPGW